MNLTTVYTCSLTQDSWICGRICLPEFRGNVPEVPGCVAEIPGIVQEIRGIALEMSRFSLDVFMVLLIFNVIVHP